MTPGEPGNPPQVRFIADSNVGKLAKGLRMMGYDTLLFKGQDDGAMVHSAAVEGRTILTRDTEIPKRRAVASGEVRVVLLENDDPDAQLREVVSKLGLKWRLAPFSICLEDNQPLQPRNRDEVRDAVPAYVFKNQEQYMQCPACGRVFWRGSHWKAMEEHLQRLEGTGTR